MSILANSERYCDPVTLRAMTLCQLKHHSRRLLGLFVFTVYEVTVPKGNRRPVSKQDLCGLRQGMLFKSNLQLDNSWDTFLRERRHMYVCLLDHSLVNRIAYHEKKDRSRDNS